MDKEKLIELADKVKAGTATESEKSEFFNALKGLVSGLNKDLKDLAKNK